MEGEEEGETTEIPEEEREREKESKKGKMTIYESEVEDDEEEEMGEEEIKELNRKLEMIRGKKSVDFETPRKEREEEEVKSSEKVNLRQTPSRYELRDREIFLEEGKKLNDEKINEYIEDAIFISTKKEFKNQKPYLIKIYNYLKKENISDTIKPAQLREKIQSLVPREKIEEIKNLYFSPPPKAKKETPKKI
jgi:hypothetical protein